jgi:hypothetical protein
VSGLTSKQRSAEVVLGCCGIFSEISSVIHSSTESEPNPKEVYGFILPVFFEIAQIWQSKSGVDITQKETF